MRLKYTNHNEIQIGSDLETHELNLFNNVQLNFQFARYLNFQQIISKNFTFLIINLLCNSTQYRAKDSYQHRQSRY